MQRLQPRTGLARWGSRAPPVLRSSNLQPVPLLDELDRQGTVLRLGGFAVIPIAQVSVAYDDNVDATNDDRQSDVSLLLSSGVRAQSLLARHSLGFEVNATATPIGKTDTPFDWSVGADGRLDLTPRSALNATLSFTHGTESAESPEAGQSPTVTEINGTLAYSQQLRRLGWSLGTGIGHTQASEDGNSDSDKGPANAQNGTDYTLFANASYRLTRRVTAVLQSSVEFDEFDNQDDEASRDSRTLEGGGGLEFRVTPTLSLTGGVGYSQMVFEDSARGNEQSVLVDLGIDGAIPLGARTDFSLGLSRSLEPVTVQDAGSATVTALDAQITHQLSRLAAASLGVGLERSEYSGEDRTDHEVTVEIGFSRALTARAALNLGYRYSQRFSNQKDDEFYRNVFTVGTSISF